MEFHVGALLVEVDTEPVCRCSGVEDVVGGPHGHEQGRICVVILVLHEMSLRLLVPLLLAAFTSPMALLATVMTLVVLGRAAAARPVLAAA
jgi:hypothetical protein